MGKDKWRKQRSWVYLEKEAGKRKRSDGNEGRPEEWHCHGGSKVAKRNDALCEGRLEMRMVTVIVTPRERHVEVSRDVEFVPCMGIVYCQQYKNEEIMNCFV